jgi:DNA integrity scanning protein DisA with diadenylate cyclase activity
MFNDTTLTELEKVAALEIVELILNTGSITQVANIGSYGDFVGEMDMVVFSLDKLVGKATRAIETLGGERYQRCVAGFGCDTLRREQFDDYIAHQVHSQMMERAGEVVRVQQ